MPDLGSTLERLFSKPESERRIGPFVLVRQLGRGGFAPVWLAKETFGGETLRAAAVKIFALDEHDSSASRRIIAEASALCRVEHPNVVRFYSLAVDEDLGILGLGMEFVAGRSVAMRLDHAGLMRPDQVIDLGLEIASALEAVHRAGIVHRDIKPANIMETDQGYKLVDFGISLTATVFPDMTWAPSSDPDCTGRVAALQSGTLGYVDPVMIAVGAPASPMSDLYALGATLFECLTGQLPASCDRKTFDEHILDGRKPPPPISIRATHAPSELAAIIDKLVSPDRSQRYSSAQEVFRALERVREASAPSLHSTPIRRPFFSARAVLPALATMVALSIGSYGFWGQRSPVVENAAATPTIEMEPIQPLVRRDPEQSPTPAEPRPVETTVRDKPLSAPRQTQPSVFLAPRAPSATAVVPSSATPPAATATPSTIAPPPVSSASSRPKLLLPPARDW
jgi:serine/threonine protein kinase